MSMTKTWQEEFRELFPATSRCRDNNQNDIEFSSVHPTALLEAFIAKTIDEVLEKAAVIAINTGTPGSRDSVNIVRAIRSHKQSPTKDI